MVVCLSTTLHKPSGEEQRCVKPRTWVKSKTTEVQLGMTSVQLWVDGCSILYASCAHIWGQLSTCDASQAPHLLQSPPRCLAPCVGQPWRKRSWALHVECIMPARNTAFVLCVWKALYWSPGEMEGPLIWHPALLTDRAHKHKTYLFTLFTLTLFTVRLNIDNISLLRQRSETHFISKLKLKLHPIVKHVHVCSSNDTFYYLI